MLVLCVWHLRVLRIAKRTACSHSQDAKSRKSTAQTRSMAHLQHIYIVLTVADAIFVRELFSITRNANVRLIRTKSWANRFLERSTRGGNIGWRGSVCYSKDMDKNPNRDPQGRFANKLKDLKHAQLSHVPSIDEIANNTSEPSSQPDATVANFSCPVVTLSDVQHHPNADRLDIATVGGYNIVVGRDSWKSGDKAVYLPEASVLPESLITELGLEGRLAGSDHNRVKAAKLRGVLSQGLVVGLDSPHLQGVEVGDGGTNMADALGVTKWVPPIPVKMQGLVEGCAWPHSFDVESWQKPDAPVFTPGEHVHVSEKLHGTFCLLGWHAEEGPTVASKGMVGRTRFKVDTDRNSQNLYCRSWFEHGDKITEYAAQQGFRNIELMGEVTGPGVQDMTYGLEDPGFYGFNVRVNGETVSPEEAYEIFEQLGVPTVPVVAESEPFNHETMLAYASEKSAIDNQPTSKQSKARHKHRGLREGVVVHSLDEPGKRVKYINDDYLTRRGGTEFN